MEHSVEEYMVQESGEGMVEVSGTLTHVFDETHKATEILRFRTFRGHYEEEHDKGLGLPFTCPVCGEEVQMPTLTLDENGFLILDPKGLQELARRYEA